MKLSARSRWSFLMGLTFILIMCSKDDDPGAAKVFLDTRDGSTYKIAVIGSQTWMSENLRYKIAGKSHCYDNEDVNCYLYGALYTHDDAAAACPPGWHLPTQDEYETLVEFLGGTTVAGTLLQPGSKLDGKEIGFNVLAAGSYLSSYSSLGVNGTYWTASEGGYPDSWVTFTYSPATVNVIGFGGASPAYSFSCRCAKN